MAQSDSTARVQLGESLSLLGLLTGELTGAGMTQAATSLKAHSSMGDDSRKLGLMYHLL